MSNSFYVKTTRDTLMKALAHAQGVCERRNTIPILANVLMTVRSGRLSLTATDLEIAILEDVDISGGRDGTITAPAATLYDIMRKLPAGAEIEMEHPGGDAQMKLRSGRFSTSLFVLPVEDFPAMGAGQMPHRFSLSPIVLRGMIDRTLFAISTEETRYYLNGIYLHATVADGARMLRAVATDGHRLARVEEPLPEGAEAIPGVIIPRKTIGELRKLLDNAGGSVEISLSDTRIQFKVGPIALTSKLIDGTFPEYERVIPAGNDKILRVGKKVFSDAVARVAAISKERSRPVKLALATNLLTISAADAECGTASEEIGGDDAQYDSDPVEIGFQARYLNDITDQIADSLEFALSDGVGAAIVREAGDESALYVLMPMRV